MDNLIQGALDLHVHCAPDIMPRKVDDLEMARRVINAGMAGFCMKSHYFCTAERAKLIRTLYPDCMAIGAVALNRSVGGINPNAVEIAARAGTKIVWFPSCDAAHEQKHIFSDSKEKIPYWANIVLQMKADGIPYEPISILNQGKLLSEVYEVLEVIARNNMVLATGHLSQRETFALVKAAHQQGVKKIIITHVTFPSTFYTKEQQDQLAAYGALMEHCYTTYATNKVKFEVICDQIRSIGPNQVILSTDLGQTGRCYPDEGMKQFAQDLLNHGFGEEEIKLMMVKNSMSMVQ